MKKLGFIFGIFILMSFFLSVSVQADASIDNLVIQGLDKLTTEYEAGTNPATIDLTKGLELYDNADKLAPEKLLVDYTTVDFNRVGTYQMYYYVLYVVDGNSLRYNVASVTIDIVDHTKPVIHGVHTLFVKLGTQSIDYTKGVYATDNDEGSDLTIRVFYYGVDLSTAGTYDVVYYTIDRSGNDTSVQTKLVVEKSHPNVGMPVITLSKATFSFPQNTQETNYLDFVSASEGTTDLTDFIQYDDSGVDYTTVGQYTVYFIVADRYGNIATKEATVNIVEDTDPPQIIGLGDTYDLTINTLNFTKGITAMDDVCGDVTNRIAVTHETDFDATKEGYYNVVYSVSDLNGNTTTKEVRVHVFDNLPPVITGPNSINLKKGSKLDLLDKIKVTDNYDDTVDYALEKNNLNPDKVGSYIIEIVASDSHHNMEKKKIIVNVYNENLFSWAESPIVIGSLVGIGVSAIITLFGYKMSKKKR